MNPAYIHLRIHTEFSVTDGIVRIDEAVARAQALNMPALGMADLSNLFGLVKFYKACRSAGIKPILGCDVWLENEANLHEPHRALLICTSNQGYLQLCEWLTRAYRDNQPRGRAELKPEWLLGQVNPGLIALSGAHWGDVGQALLAGQTDLAQARAQRWAQAFPQAYYLELQRLQHGPANACTELMLELAAELNLPPVATHPIQFMNPDDYKAHEARVCIAEGYVLADKRRPKVFGEDQFFLSTEAMQTLFADAPEALLNSVHIAARCNVNIQLGKSFLPQFPTPPGMSLDDFLVARAQQGLQERMMLLYPDANARAEAMPTYQARLEFECNTIIQMGFPGYFLIVADFINWAKNNGVPVGPGRGSGAGSLVAYSLGITDIDPLRYALLFERFLNPERVSMPDFDIDFCQDNRYRVIDYVRLTYGVDAVSQIVTFGTMAAKAVIRDVGRVLDLPYNFVDQLSKLIPSAPGKQYSLDDALDMEPVLKTRMEQEEEVGELFALARKLEGLTRNVGMHAGGVLIAPGKLTDFCPLYLAPAADAVPVSQFDKDDVEQIGLVKFDFLGLRNLTIIELALDYIEQSSGERPNLLMLPFTDPAAYQVLKDANTTAIFQLESSGMKKLLAKLQPDRFEDIIAVLALYRPGPLGSGMVDDFILRKKGEQSIDYFHPNLEACLSPTYGVIVYQEQVMQISQIIGGYTLGGADMLRRAMGKKKPEEMAKHRGMFVEGAEKAGYDPKLAENLFDLMAKFAEYGFNKSHTAAYAVVSYHTAWLKAHHPAAFMAATMSSEMDNTDQLKIFYEDCLLNKIKILPPDINRSFYRFTPEGPRSIRYGLGAVKGTGETAVEAIIATREQAPFKDLFDFCLRVDKRQINKRTVEALIRAGAFDSIHPNRAELLLNVPLALEAAEQATQHAHQSSLFAEEGVAPAPAMTTAPAWDAREQLQQEKQALGFYISGHLFDAYRQEVRQFVRQPLSRLQPHKEPQKLAGIITAVRIQMGRRGKMAFARLDDGESSVEVSIFGDLYENSRALVKEDELLMVEGKVSHDDFNGGLRVVADKLWNLTTAREMYARKLWIQLSHEQAQAQKLLQLLEPHRGGQVSVELQYRRPEGTARLQLSSTWSIRPSEVFMENLTAWLGKDSVSLIYG